MPIYIYTHLPVLCVLVAAPSTSLELPPSPCNVAWLTSFCKAFLAMAASLAALVLCFCLILFLTMVKHFSLSSCFLLAFSFTMVGSFTTKLPDLVADGTSSLISFSQMLHFRPVHKVYLMYAFCTRLPASVVQKTRKDTRQEKIVWRCFWCLPVKRALQTELFGKWCTETPSMAGVLPGTHIHDVRPSSDEFLGGLTEKLCRKSTQFWRSRCTAWPGLFSLCAA